MKTIIAVLLFVTLVFASMRSVSGRGQATDMDQNQARAEAREQAADNLQNACSGGTITTMPQAVTDECHMAGPGSETCIVVLVATCESH